MKHLVLTLACAVMMTGCASSKAGQFGPAYGSDFGYRNTQIQQDRFRISYTSRDAYESRDFALLRAAQVATNEGYSHFKIVSGDFYDNGPNMINSHIGIGSGGKHRKHSHVDIGVQDVTRAIEGRKATETIEVVLLTSAAPNDPSVYSAQSIIRNIVPMNQPQPKAKTP